MLPSMGGVTSIRYELSYPKLKTMRIKLIAASLFLAPLFYTASSFFWNTQNQYGTYDTTSGLLLIVGSIFWVPAFLALFDMLRERTPNYASWGFLFAVYGCL